MNNLMIVKIIVIYYSFKIGFSMIGQDPRVRNFISVDISTLESIEMKHLVFPTKIGKTCSSGRCCATYQFLLKEKDIHIYKGTSYAGKRVKRQDPNEFRARCSIIYLLYTKILK